MPIPTGRAQVITGDSAGGDALRARPNERFWLVHYAEYEGAWEIGTVDGKPRLLPALTKSIEAAGVSGYRMLRRGDPPARAYSLAHSWIRERGGTVIPHDIQIGDEVGYLARVSCSHRGASGFFHHERWVSYSQPRPGKRPKPVVDVAAYARFRAGLVDEGHIAPPSAGYLAQMRRRLVSAAGEIRNRQIQNETARAEMIAGADRAIADFDIATAPPEPPKPKPKTTRRKTTKAGKPANAEPARVDAPNMVSE